MKKIGTVNIATTWISVLNMVKSGVLNVKDADLERPCKMFDMIILNQQSGAKSVTFNFAEDGTTFITVERE